MPRPRKRLQDKTITAKKTTTGKKIPNSKARKGERLLVTCAPILPHHMIEDVAESLHGSFFNDPDGRYLQVVAVRIDGRKVYGRCQEMYEAAPFMFAPVPH